MWLAEMQISHTLVIVLYFLMTSFKISADWEETWKFQIFFCLGKWLIEYIKQDLKLFYYSLCLENPIQFSCSINKIVLEYFACNIVMLKERKWRY